MMTNGKKVLLAFGKEPLSKVTSKVLQEAGFQVTVLSPKTPHLSKKRYDHIVQLGSEPRTLAEGTRQFLEKAKEEKANFLLVSSLKTSCQSPSVKKTTACEALHLAEALTQESHHKHGVSTAILRLPVLYGPEIPFKESGSLGELISEFAAEQTAAKPGATLTIYGEGKDGQHYLYLTDAAKAIKIALTVGQRAGTVYDALPPAPFTSITIANTLKEMGGGRHEIHHHRGLAPLEEPVKPEGKILPKFKPQVSLKEGLLKTLKALSLEKEQALSKTRLRGRLPKIVIRLPRLRRPSRRCLITTAIVLLLLSPFLYVGGRAALAAYNLSQLYQQMSTSDFQAAGRSAAKAEKHLTSLSRIFNLIPSSKSTNGGPLRSLASISQGGAEATAALEKVASEGETINLLIENLLKSHRGEATTDQAEEEFNRLAVTLKEAENHLLTSNLYLTQVKSPFDRWLVPLLDYLQQGINALKLGNAFASAAPDLLGYYGERSYLILLQNSAEARAGGGFLGSLAQITLKDGGIKTLEVFDSYQFDAAEEHSNITAPDPLRRYLGIEKLPLRESNFYASFPESGQRVSQLYEDIQEIYVDGVIGINLLLARELVTLIGPLELSDFERTVTGENLFEVTTEEVEKDFFPGSSKKKRFLKTLGENLLNNLFTLEKKDYPQLARIMWEGLEKRDVLLFFREENLTQALLGLSFDGRIETSSNDFLLTLDTNFGTKTNLTMIKRSVDYEVFNPNREDDLAAKLTVTWEHTGTDAWPSGTYSNLFRVLVPKGSVLTEVTFDGEDYFSRTMTTEEAGKTEFATFLTVEPQTTAVLKLGYRLAPSLNLKNLDRYRLDVRKQPGTAGDAFAFSFEEPFGKRISSENCQREGNSLTFRENLQYDITVEVTIEEAE